MDRIGVDDIAEVLLTLLPSFVAHFKRHHADSKESLYGQVVGRADESERSSVPVAKAIRGLADGL